MSSSVHCRVHEHEDTKLKFMKGGCVKIKRLSFCMIANNNYHNDLLFYFFNLNVFYAMYMVPFEVGIIERIKVVTPKKIVYWATL